jgi:hypothetical protein
MLYAQIDVLTLRLNLELQLLKKDRQDPAGRVRGTTDDLARERLRIAKLGSRHES